jgi:hypothetical protein
MEEELMIDEVSSLALRAFESFYRDVALYA